MPAPTATWSRSWLDCSANREPRAGPFPRVSATAAVRACGGLTTSARRDPAEARHARGLGDCARLCRHVRWSPHRRRRRGQRARAPAHRRLATGRNLRHPATRSGTPRAARPVPGRHEPPRERNVSDLQRAITVAALADADGSRVRVLVRPRRGRRRHPLEPGPRTPARCAAPAHAGQPAAARPRPARLPARRAPTTGRRRGGPGGHRPDQRRRTATGAPRARGPRRGDRSATP